MAADGPQREIGTASDDMSESPSKAGYSRRRFLACSAVGTAAGTAGTFFVGGAPVGSGTGAPSPSASDDGDSEFVVQPTPSRYFIRRENGSYEMKWGSVGAAALGTPARQHEATIPNDRFFIHNRAHPPTIDVRTWRLSLTGDALARPRSFTSAQLLAMPQVTLHRTLDCGANCAAFFPKLPPSGSGDRWLPEGFTQWHFGAVGAAEWTGVRAKDVLAAAGAEGMADVQFIGLDIISDPSSPGGKAHYSEVIPAETALKDDTLLVYRMNGADLPVDHGYPLRLLCSGWGGNHNVKWLGEIHASKHSIPVAGPAKNQVQTGPHYLTPVRPTVGPVRSAIEHDPEVTLTPGDHTLYGRAWSGAGTIDRVDVTVEKLVKPGQWTTTLPWHHAKLLTTPEPFMWVRFELPWQGVQPGYYRVMTRARDRAGNVQPRPEDVVWNRRGLGYNGHFPLELIVLATSDMP
jgi:DMSO/TMAO reductase YedYZ molybdopterin-dependent catalytic subunit